MGSPEERFILVEGLLKSLLEKISKDEKSRIGEKLREYAQEPLKYATKLTSPKIGTLQSPRQNG